jgi:hypothetical protein
VTASFSRDVLLAYTRRPWDRIRRVKEQFWAEDAAAHGPEAGLRAGQLLREHMARVDPTWPTADLRQLDLEHHQALAARLRRLAHVFPRG